MAEKKKSGRKAAAPEAPVVPPPSADIPMAEAAPPTVEDVPMAEAVEPDAKPAGAKSAAARMLTKSLVVKKSAAARGDTQRVADATKPSQMPAAGGGRRGPRRGASKGR